MAITNDPGLGIEPLWPTQTSDPKALASITKINTKLLQEMADQPCFVGNAGTYKMIYIAGTE
jgi:hypothetical protein